MAASEQAKPPCRREDALAVLRGLRDAEHVAYFAGGCVRDTLLGLEPKDWDVATDAPPKRVRELFSRTQAVGAAFGVILVRLGKSVVEVATFRTDGDYSDGRRPDSVRFATPEEDAQRRDFTINGLFLDPIDDRVIDFVGGQDDLKTRTLRAIGEPEKRFAEDYLRLLRAVRFAARFGLTVEPATMRAIVDNAAKLPRISPERIGDELRAMLTPPTRTAARDLLWTLGLMQVLMRRLPHGTVPQVTHDVLGALPRDRPVSFPLALAALLVDWLSFAGHLFRLDAKLVREVVNACRETLRISNDESDHLAQCLDLRALLEIDEPRVSTAKRFLARPYAGDALELFRAHHVIPTYENRVHRRTQTLEELARGEVAPLPLVTGDDLVADGFRPGPKFKGVLDELYDAQLEGRLTDRDAALRLARELMSR